MSYVARATYDKTQPGVASIPPAWWDSNSGALYVRLSATKHSETLKAAKRMGASGNQIWVRPGTLGLNDEESAPVTVMHRTRLQFRRDWLFLTWDGRLASAGLTLAVLGLAIPLSFGFGETFVVFVTVSDESRGRLMWLSSGLELIGVALLFARGWLGKA